ncbi:MAG TPA: 5-methyltetrahydrofolate--homocysteine methyltransferase, partial [Candidatus Hydrogenedentes bacterium]|nr:5-methyltetrahydrofolate--homocysteine methyltransferase [Candidatus Hydrogenedentota bacterium]
MPIRPVVPPSPPFFGARVLDAVPLDAVFALVNETALFRGRWGYRRGEMDADAYRDLIEREVRPRFLDLKRIVKAERVFTPRVVYGWFKAR